ncbi:hypothetical protein MKJ04_16960 [Pontibacter sp. E15-1]|uniref:hypothetical protein n=1 Tax=Pontibacter sp. E15-1 TaxID=2919918 RepID=UPI001F501D79|nr:hypothetical protein [Pontibacter sp. E15-1]MCJ8166538.1 hypothetical protein [Pontibacter sp. E15-1]
MKALLLCFTLLTFACFGCTKEADELRLRTADAAPVVQVVVADKVLTVGESATLTVFFEVRNGCGEFGSFDTNSDGQTLTVRVIPHYREGFCTQALETRETTYTFTPKTKGTYTLKFWAGENDYISETIVVQ